MPRQPTFKDKLKDILSKEELSNIKTAFDIVGDIAILELDEEFSPKKQEIAKALLETHKNINTVLNKAGEHEGEFRTQKMEFLAGVDKRIGLHKENNTFIYVDVENVYFSARLSTERKRIMQQVKKGENILVMFSGSAPYPCVLGKNTNARRISGVEINPKGHELGLENIKKNKLNNVDLYNGDVNDIVPDLINTPIIGIKSNWRKEHIDAKFVMAEKTGRKVELLEIYIGCEDLENNYDDFYNTIKGLSKTDMKIVLHAPHKFKGNEVSVCRVEKDVTKTTTECFSILDKMCKELSLLGFVGHPHTLLVSDEKFVMPEYSEESFEKFFTDNNFKFLFLETMVEGIFNNIDFVESMAKKFNLSLCIDTAHLYDSSRKEDDFYDALRRLRPFAKYYHINDAKYLFTTRFLGNLEEYMEKHCYTVGKGNINFDMVVPNVKFGCAEVISKSELNPVEMIDSWQKLNIIAQELQKFDRILMPLPKSAEDFLPTALLAAKSGTIIHFYDFLHEKNFKEAEEKVQKACKHARFKYKKLDFVKCGQHSPRTFRICLDFQVS